MEEKRSMHITSKGCSRGFILCVLYRALDYVRQRHLAGDAVQFPFCPDKIMSWLVAAQMDCSISEHSFQAGLGGTFYNVDDASSYWTQPQQFCTWWKNNIERKNKLLLLQRDASYCEETDSKQMARASYCQNAIAMSLSMKKYFHRYLSKDKCAMIVQYTIPYPMPTHMASPYRDLKVNSYDKSASPVALKDAQSYVDEDTKVKENDPNIMNSVRSVSECGTKAIDFYDSNISVIDRKRKQGQYLEMESKAILKQLRKKEKYRSQYSNSSFTFAPHCSSDNGSENERKSPHGDTGLKADISHNVDVSETRISVEQDISLSSKTIFQPLPPALVQYSQLSPATFPTAAYQNQSLFHTPYTSDNESNAERDNLNHPLSYTSWPLQPTSVSTTTSLHQSLPFAVDRNFDDDLMALLTEDIDNSKLKTNDDLLLSISLSPCFTAIQHHDSIEDNSSCDLSGKCFDIDFMFDGHSGDCSLILHDTTSFVPSTFATETDKRTSLQYTIADHNNICLQDKLNYSYGSNDSSLEANDCADLLAIIPTIIDDVHTEKLKYAFMSTSLTPEFERGFYSYEPDLSDCSQNTIGSYRSRVVSFDHENLDLEEILNNLD